MGTYSAIRDALERHQRHMVATGGETTRVRAWKFSGRQNIIHFDFHVHVHSHCGACYGTLRRLDAARVQLHPDDLEKVVDGIMSAAGSKP